jgi:hypothetical protein
MGCIKSQYLSFRACPGISKSNAQNYEIPAPQDFPEKQVAFCFASVADAPWRAGMTRFLTF